MMYKIHTPYSVRGYDVDGASWYTRIVTFGQAWKHLKVDCELAKYGVPST